MGCLFSKFALESSSQCQDDNQVKSYSWDNREKVNPADFTIDGLNEKEEGRVPGKINGQQFIIQNCKNARIFLFDFIDTITIDDCCNCTFFIGPTKGSLFLRDCIDCSLVSACGQFRSRDCRNCDIYLYCKTQPIIEASTRMRFGCFQSNYPQLKDHFKSAGLSLWENNWSRIHDFTPVEGERNWSKLLDPDIVHEMILFPQDEDLAQVGLCLKSDESLIPWCSGNPAICYEDCEVILVCEDFALELTLKMLKEKISIEYIRELPVDPSAISKMGCNDYFPSAYVKSELLIAILCIAGYDAVLKKICSEVNESSSSSEVACVINSISGNWAEKIFSSVTSMEL